MHGREPHFGERLLWRCWVRRIHIHLFLSCAVQSICLHLPRGCLGKSSCFHRRTDPRTGLRFDFPARRPQVWTTNRMHAALPENCLCMCAPVGRVAARRLFEQGIVSDGGSPCPHCPQHDSFDKVLRFGRNLGGGGGGGGGGTSKSWRAAPDPALVV